MYRTDQTDQSPEGNRPDQYGHPQSKEDPQKRYRIHFEHSDGTADSFVVEGSEQACIEMALAGIHRRNGKNPWSEQLPCEQLP